MTHAPKPSSIVNLTKTAIYIVKSKEIDSPELTNTLQRILELAESTAEQNPADMGELLAGEGEEPSSLEEAFTEMLTLSRESM